MAGLVLAILISRQRCLWKNWIQRHNLIEITARQSITVCEGHLTEIGLTHPNNTAIRIQTRHF